MKPPPCFPGKQTRKRSKKRQIRDFIAIWVAAIRDLLPVTITFWSSWITTRGTYGFGSLSRKTKQLAVLLSGNSRITLRTNLVERSSECVPTMAQGTLPTRNWTRSSPKQEYSMNPHRHNDRNAVSERMIRTLKEVATSMLAQASLPHWSEAVDTATHLRNWLISKASLTRLLISHYILKEKRIKSAT